MKKEKSSFKKWRRCFALCSDSFAKKLMKYTIQSYQQMNLWCFVCWLIPAGSDQLIYLSIFASASHITAVTDLLLSKGYIARKRSENDRRIIDIELTKEGQDIFNVIQEKRAYFLERFEHFTDKEIETMNKLFHKIKGDQK